jgi:hypothetical protein
LDKENSNKAIKGTFLQFRVKKTKKEKDKEETFEVDFATKVPVLILIVIISTLITSLAGC